ncbi:hypothetical protein ACLB2K_002781 [Fragaria x ananassa]
MFLCAQALEQAPPLDLWSVQLRFLWYGLRSISVDQIKIEMQSRTESVAVLMPLDFSYADLLSPLSSEKVELRQVANLVDQHLPDECACGVVDSKIVFASGLKPNLDPHRFGPPFGPDPSTDAYAFDVHDPKQEIVKMPGELNGGKQNPLTVEFNGKLYVLSGTEYNEFVSFEVFDPQQGTWSRLPKYPSHGSDHSYAIFGTKLFMSSQENGIYYDKPEPSIFCFDLGAPDPEWRRIPGMCQGGRVPFTGRALVLDLPQPEHKMMTSFSGMV